MKITFGTTIEKAPRGFVRVRLTEEVRGTKRFVREPQVEWLEIGAGKGKDMTLRRFVILCRAIIQTAKQHKLRNLALEFDTLPKLFKNLEHLSKEEIAQHAAEAFVMANFEFTTYKTKPKEGWNDVEHLHLCGAFSVSIEKAVRKGEEIGRGVNACRELANTPGGDMTPRTLAAAAKKAVAKLPVKVTILGRKELQKLSMGAILGVAKGSPHEPTFTIMEYRGDNASGKTSGSLTRGTDAPIVLVGKGVTFDSGGLNLKPEAGMYEMHMDMSGAAAVIHSVALAARLKLKKHVIGLIPAVENTPGADAYRPGDVLRSLSGKTIEVLNTDAEGRLILADALTYAKRFKPSVVLDAATLTGAAMVALGLHANGLMTRNDELARKVLAIGETSGDYMWQLPLWDEYEESIKGTFADIANVPGNGPSSRYGGAINGGMFLWQFAKELDCLWAHIDIAPKMTAAPGEELSKGAAGSPVRFFVSFIEQWTRK